MGFRRNRLLSELTYGDWKGLTTKSGCSVPRRQHNVYNAVKTSKALYLRVQKKINQTFSSLTSKSLHDWKRRKPHVNWGCRTRVLGEKQKIACNKPNKTSTGPSTKDQTTRRTPLRRRDQTAPMSFLSPQNSRMARLLQRGWKSNQLKMSLGRTGGAGKLKEPNGWGKKDKNAPFYEKKKKPLGQDFVWTGGRSYAVQKPGYWKLPIWGILPNRQVEPTVWGKKPKTKKGPRQKKGLTCTDEGALGGRTPYRQNSIWEKLGNRGW